MGQDMVEYSLIVTFLAVASLWIFGFWMPSVAGIWATGNSHLTRANEVAGR
jgi:hypothetical protein